jgi:hypothetical protein
MDHFPHPPWIEAPDETSVSDPAKFSDCERAIDAFASRAQGHITDRRYSLSKEWGRILRAKVGVTHAGLGGTLLVICWMGAGPSVSIAIEVDGCGPQPAGC